MKQHHDPAAVAAALERRLAGIGGQLRRTPHHKQPKLIHRANVLFDAWSAAMARCRRLERTTA